MRLKLFPTLRGYRRDWLTADLIAAVTLLAIAVPEQLATSRLAGMPPITGFYAFGAGAFAFAVIGTNRHVSVGADSTIAPLFALSVGRLAMANSTRYGEFVAILAVMVGIVLALVWLLRLGWIAQFLSTPVITGFLAGIAVVIVVHQLPDLFGVAGGSGETISRLKTLTDHLGQFQATPCAIGLAVFLVVFGVQRFKPRIPAALITLVIATVITAALRLDRHGVAVLGHVAHAAPTFGLTGINLTTIGQLAPIAGIVALIVITQSAATSRAFAQSGTEDVGVDLLAIGAGNVLAGLAGAFPINASPPRTAAVAGAGGRTQLASIVAAVVLLALVPAAGLLQHVPLAALAGILLFVATRVFRLGDLRAIARFDHFELALALATLITVALAGVEWGIGVAVALAILDRTRISAKPQLHVLGRLPGSTSWVPLSAVANAAQIENVLVVLFATPLWYANTVHFRTELDNARRRARGMPQLIVLDALGMTDIDFTGTQTLAAVLDELDKEGIRFAIARADRSIHDELQRAGLLQRIGEHNLFPSVDAAVNG